MHCDRRSRAPELELIRTHNDTFSNTVAMRPLQMPCAWSESSAGRTSLAAGKLNTDVCTAQTFKMRSMSLFRHWFNSQQGKSPLMPEKQGFLLHEFRDKS